MSPITSFEAARSGETVTGASDRPAAAPSGRYAGGFARLPRTADAPSEPTPSEPTDASGSVPDLLEIPFEVRLTHRLLFTEDVLGRDCGRLLELLPPGGIQPPRVLVYCEDTVADAHADGIQHLRRQLSAAVELVAPVNRVAGGEDCKNDPAVVDRFLRDINDHNLDRRSYVIVIGGGALLDCVGYAAAIAHRGIRLVRLPTTTLAQDDSGVGVKNAVNWFGKKNWKGTFACPWAVVNDRRLLETLPDRDFVSGFSEAVKVSLLKDADFFARIERDAGRIRRREWSACGPVIRESAVWHLKHITAGGDPFEALEARPLDFGHWSAHKLEPMSAYEIRHGEAVAMGLAIDTAYSSLVHGLDETDRDRIIGTLQGLGIPVSHPLMAEADTLLDGLEEFRQHLGGRLTLTMLRAPGQPLDVHEVDATAMKDAIQFVYGLSATEGLDRVAGQV